MTKRRILIEKEFKRIPSIIYRVRTPDGVVTVAKLQALDKRYNTNDFDYILKVYGSSPASNHISFVCFKEKEGSLSFVPGALYLNHKEASHLRDRLILDTGFFVGYGYLIVGLLDFFKDNYSYQLTLPEHSDELFFATEMWDYLGV